jgi:glycosyltransferase involved in cell wall biosynthesis
MPDSEPPAEEALPFISVVIGARNEAGYIEGCVRSLLEDDYPADRLEVLVVDGQSNDGTPDIVRKLTEADPRVRLIDNPRRITPVAFNLGIQNARGEIISIVGGHSYVEKGFLRLTARALLDHPDAWVMGGASLPIHSGYVGRVIGQAVYSPFGTGGPKYRSPGYSGYVADTVEFPSYWQWVFDKVGLFDEQLVRNQDNDMNDRVMQAGGKVFHDGRRRHYYYSRSSFGKLARQYFQYGFWRIRNIQKLRKVTTFRQIAPLLFVAAWPLLIAGALLWRPLWYALAGYAGLYLLALLAGAARTARTAGLKYALLVPLAFVILHFSYGAGSLKGIWSFGILRRAGRSSPPDQQLTR